MNNSFVFAIFFMFANPVVTQESLAQTPYPYIDVKIYMNHYLPLLDNMWSAAAGTEIKPEWQKELVSRLEEFQAAWDKASPALLKTLGELVKRPYFRKELTLNFTVQAQSSLSNPLLIYINPFLRSYDSSPFPMFEFVDFVFHELVHNILDHDWLNGKITPLMHKYRSIGFAELAHLHVIALQYQVYEALNLTEVLHWLQNDYYPWTYWTAAKVVKQEGPEAFVRELRGSLEYHPALSPEISSIDMLRR